MEINEIFETVSDTMRIKNLVNGKSRVICQLERLGVCINMEF